MGVTQTQGISFEEFLRLADDSPMELVNGEIVRMSPANLRHQDLLSFLNTLLTHFCRRRKLGRVQLAPFLVRTGEAAREPDLLFIANERLSLLRDTYLDGPPDVAVKIISYDSRRRDTEEKFDEYERAGVREYWLFDPIEDSETFFVRNAEGRFTPRPYQDGVFDSDAVPGFFLKETWLREYPYPDELSLLKQLGIL